MQPIRMVDLVTQYQHLQQEIEASFSEVLQTAAFINGPEVKAFAEELASYLGVQHVIPCANGTDALQIAMMALDFQPGDEVLVPNFTFISTVEVVALLGLTPVLVDIDPETFNMHPEAAQAAITDKTRAIVPVHLFGQCTEMDAIRQLAQTHHLVVLEDAAQAMGASYRTRAGQWHKTGSMGHIAATSFYPSKNLGCYGDGGALMTNDDALAQRCRIIANHGMAERYTYRYVGINSRLDSLQAAILRINLRHLDVYNQKRRAVADVYDAAFDSMPGIRIPKRADNTYHVYHQYTLRVLDGKRDALQQHLQQAGVPSAIFYPVPLHSQEAYAPLAQQEDRLFPHTIQATREVLSLPIHPEMQPDQVDHVIQSVRAFF